MQLPRIIRTWDLIALIINAVIGAGIFGLPSKIYLLTQASSTLVVVGCSILIGFIILCFAEVSSRFSSTGGPYLYAYRAFGRLVGFEMGWLLWLTRISAFGAVCNLLISYLAYIWPEILLHQIQYVIIFIIVGFLTIINIKGIKQSILFSNILTVSKLVPLLLFILIGFFFLDTKNLRIDSTPDIGTLASGFMIMIFAYGGFELSTINAGEIKNPRGIFPKALFTSIIIITVIYVLIQIICIGTLPNLSQSDSPLADAAHVFMGNPGGLIISVGAVISMIGALNVTLLACTRLPFAMAENKQIPQVLASIHSKYKTPHISIIISSVIILLFTFSYSFMAAVKIHVIIKLVTYAIVCISLPVFRYRKNIPAARFKVRRGIIISIISTIICLWLLSNSSLDEALYVSGAVILGILLYTIFVKFSDSKISEYKS